MAVYDSEKLHSNTFVAFHTIAARTPGSIQMADRDVTDKSCSNCAYNYTVNLEHRKNHSFSEFPASYMDWEKTE